MNADQIALQLYTVRDAASSDMLDTLRALAQMGYRAVETAGFGNATPQTVRATLDELGMRAISAHTAFDRLRNDTDRTLDEIATLGCPFVVVPFLAPDLRASVDTVREVAQQLNRIGERCRDAGIQLGYHNHAFEFEALDGTTMWDVLTAETDPSLVVFELDVFWAQVGGRDPIATIQQLGNRAAMLHLKDMQQADPPTDAPVGDGIIAWPPILDAGAAAGAQWYIVEQDHPRQPLPDVERSLRNLEGLAGR